MDARVTLKKKSDFNRLYARGKSCVTPYMVVYCRYNSLGNNRLGYTVSKKLGGAVVRNRIRRRLREIYRLNSPSLKSGYDIVIVARSKAIEAEYKKLDKAFLHACGELRLIRESAEASK